MFFPVGKLSVARCCNVEFQSGGTTTLGTDDTVKSSGFRTHDTQTGQLTLVNKLFDCEEKKRFHISHSGVDSGESYKLWISEMALLVDTSFEEMKSYITFYTNDRAGDSDTMLDAMDIPEDRRLNVMPTPSLQFKMLQIKPSKMKRLKLESRN